MSKFLVILLAVVSLSAQAPRPNPEAAPQTPEARAASMAALLEQQPDVRGLSAILRTLRMATKVSDEVKARAEDLSARGVSRQAAGATGEARRLLAQAAALLLGRPWGPVEEFAASLALRPAVIVADLSEPLVGHISQTYPAGYPGAKRLRLRLSLAEAAPRTAIDLVVPSGKMVRDIGVWDLPVRDLADEPFYFDASLADVPEGSYLLTAQVLDAEAVAARVSTPVHLVRGLASQRAALEAKLALMQGHDSAKATIRYPFDLARGLNARRREVVRFDFAAAVRGSAGLMASLESGRDPLVRSTGDHNRHYWFAEAGEVVPYRLYVPTTWDGRKKLPMIVALHGSNTDENRFLERAGGVMAKLAERHGYIVACPLGFRINGAYGNPFQPPIPGARPAAPPDPARARVSELSEKDVLNVTDLVAKEYDVDRSRMYLMGISMGGGGTWHLGAKYAGRWAAIAPASFPIRAANYPYEKLQGLPVLFVNGDLDPLVPPDAARALVEHCKSHGADITYIEVKGGTHPTAVEIAMPQIFEFFNRHARK